MTYVMLNHQPVPAQDAVVSVHDRGFRYGDGVFETIIVNGGAPYRFGWHMARLARGLEAARIDCDLSLLPAECVKLLAMNEVEEALLRIQITRGSAGRGYLPVIEAEPTVVIETMVLPDLPSEAVTLWLSSFRRIPASALPVHAKLCQGLNSTLARMEANDNRCFDGLQLNTAGEICETSSGNIFWLSGQTLYTPSIDCGIVEGAMRAAIIEMSPYPIKEVRAMPDTLRQADAVCITNTAWQALPVGGLKPEGWEWQSERLARKLSDLLIDDMRRQAVKVA